MATRKPAANKTTNARRKPGPKPKSAALDQGTGNTAVATTGNTSAATPPNSFKFELMEGVAINLSRESGHVRARAQYVNNSPCYLVAYKSARGEFTQAWIEEDLLTSTDL